MALFKVLKPNVRLTKSADQSITTGAAITWDTDTHTEGDALWVSGSQLIIPKDGWYIAHCCARRGSVGTSSQWFLQLERNAVRVSRVNHVALTGAATLSVSLLDYCEEGDTIEALAGQPSGTFSILASEAFLTLGRVGPKRWTA